MPAPAPGTPGGPPRLPGAGSLVLTAAIPIELAGGPSIDLIKSKRSLFVRAKLSDRKLRLFACACVRRRRGRENVMLDETKISPLPGNSPIVFHPSRSRVVFLLVGAGFL